MKRTKWFSVKTPPIRPGRYEVVYHGQSPTDDVCIRVWNGKEWRCEFGSQWIWFGELKGDRWRGLAEKP